MRTKCDSQLFREWWCWKDTQYFSHVASGLLYILIDSVPIHSGFSLASSLVKCIHTYDHVMTCMYIYMMFLFLAYVGKGISHLSANSFTYTPCADRLLTTALKIADKCICILVWAIRGSRWNGLTMEIISEICWWYVHWPVYKLST